LERQVRSVVKCVDANNLGIQGGSVVRFLLKSKQFRVRGITRNTQGVRAKELSSQGVDIVEASLDNVESLKRAFRGVYGVFGVTNYWEHGEEREIQQGINMVNAAKEENVQHFVYSTIGLCQYELN
jgi:uncharacterized protein YbjT (DUF2867 family)